MPLIDPIPPAERVEDTCDYCQRAFARARTTAAVCPSCGFENVRKVSPVEAREAPAAVESNMLPGGPEKAVQPAPQLKPRPRKRKNTS
jgi:hypothetical protein